MSPTSSTVLVAEGSVALRAVLRQHLAAQGLEVVEAEDGTSALELCRQEMPDLVLLDGEADRRAVHDVLAALKSDDDLRDIPVVLLAGAPSTEDVVAAMRLGAHDYLRKPFDAADVVARVTAALRARSLNDELRQRDEELEVLSRTDGLTGAHNRRHLGEQLRALSSAAVRHRFPLGVLMIDLDHFHALNARAGQAAGDAVLCVVAARIRASVRNEDVVGRWGGEEFLVLLPYSDLQGSAVLAERVRQRIAGTPVSVADGAPLPVTVSVGCAAGDGGDPDELVRQADRNLYRAKLAGRNRVEAQPPEGAGKGEAQA